MNGLLGKLGRDPLVYVHQLDLLNDSVLLVQLNESELRNHSFLDQRIFRQDMPFEWVTWPGFEAVANTLPANAPSYIFHIGHCGSTLLSRLVAAATDTQALREPLPLRAIAGDRAEGRAAMLDDSNARKRLGLFERTWTAGRAATTIKATSMCTNVIDLVDERSPVVFVHQQPETHLAVVLAGQNALQDLRGFGQNRYRRLSELTPDLPPLASFSIGDLAALTWLAEVSSAARALQTRSAMKLDFDEFLERPAEGLADACEWLGLATTPEKCAAAVSGPIMRSYSKAPEHPYDSRLRDDVIADSRQRNAREIARGMELIERFRSTTCGEDWR